MVLHHMIKNNLLREWKEKPKIEENICQRCVWWMPAIHNMQRTLTTQQWENNSIKKWVKELTEDI